MDVIYLVVVFFLVQVTGHTFEVETDTFKLRNIMEAPLLKFKEEIEVSKNKRFTLYLKKISERVLTDNDSYFC